MRHSELFSDLYAAYLCAKKHKANSRSHLDFRANLYENLVELTESIANHSYCVRPSICFINENPVKREIIAADFRDRVVHHFLFNLINPYFERQFIYDSYSCRKGKGTLFGIERLEHFMRSVSDNYHKKTYVLKLDISGFFMSINRDKLYELCLKTLSKVWNDSKNAGTKVVLYKEKITFLLQKIIYNDPLDKAVYKSPPSAWNDLPHNKSLKNSPANCGLPIGNLTSQLFGNIYLNPLDHFVKRELNIEGYGRYVDDFFLLSNHVKELVVAKERIRVFLSRNLHLKLHPQKVYLQPIEHGVNFVGAYVLPYRKYLSRRIQRNCRKAMLSEECSVKSRERLVSYMGQMRHFDCYRFLNRVLGLYLWPSYPRCPFLFVRAKVPELCRGEGTLIPSQNCKQSFSEKLRTNRTLTTCIYTNGVFPCSVGRLARRIRMRKSK